MSFSVTTCWQQYVAQCALCHALMAQDGISGVGLFRSKTSHILLQKPILWRAPFGVPGIE